MRLFFLNQESVFTPALISTRSNVTQALARRELALLARAGFVVRRKEHKGGTKPLDGWKFNQRFEYAGALENLLFGTEFINLQALARRVKGSGRIKLLLLSGVFNRDANARLDLLLVGDNLKRPVVERIMRSLEAEIGKELAYAVFETQEFVYRASMYDKLIRDVIDFPHKKIINIGGLLEQVPQAHDF